MELRKKLLDAIANMEKALANVVQAISKADLSDEQLERIVQLIIKKEIATQMLLNEINKQFKTKLVTEKFLYVANAGNNTVSIYQLDSSTDPIFIGQVNSEGNLSSPYWTSN